MRRLCMIMLVFLLPAPVMARCVPFNFFDSLNSIPFIVHGRVTQSNRQDLLSAQCRSAPCQHMFSVEVIETLKGNVSERRLSFVYNYANQRPEVMLFAEGAEYVFAVSRIRPNGQATIYGSTCGRPGTEITNLDRLRRTLSR